MSHYGGYNGIRSNYKNRRVRRMGDRGSFDSSGYNYNLRNSKQNNFIAMNKRSLRQSPSKDKIDVQKHWNFLKKLKEETAEVQEYYFIFGPSG